MHRAAAQQDDLRKRSALGRVSASPAQGVHRQRSHTIDYEDHLERQKKAEEAEKKERKAQAKLEKEKEKAKRQGNRLLGFLEQLISNDSTRNSRTSAFHPIPPARNTASRR